ncbi:MAG: hypothetical protein IH841_05670 [Thaumarchaeota archaeon]|nr:hypothetical protein [Nitrososphaerota archaeon]
MKNVKAKKRGVSVVISALLILAITVVGALFVSDIVKSSSIPSISQTTKSNAAASSVILTAYDTRDGSTLSVIPTLNNKFDEELCTDRCKAFSDNIPTSAAGEGTDFIVIQVRNKNVNHLTIHGIQVNGISHTWDTQTGGKPFDASIDDSTGNYPLAGKFSVIPITNDLPIVQRTSANLNGDEEVRLVIKLNSNIQPDIALGEPIRVLLNLGSPQPVKYIISTGETK